MSNPRLEVWEWDGKTFTGFIYNLEHWKDGEVFTTGTNFVDWSAKRILVGERLIELGGSREELNNNDDTEGNELPW